MAICTARGNMSGEPVQEDKCVQLRRTDNWQFDDARETEKARVQSSVHALE